MLVTLYLNKSGNSVGPLGLLSGSPYRRNLLSLVFVYILSCNSSNAKRFTLVTLHLNKSGNSVGPLRATVWAPVQEKLAVIGILVHPIV